MQAKVTHDNNDTTPVQGRQGPETESSRRGRGSRGLVVSVKGAEDDLFGGPPDEEGNNDAVHKHDHGSLQGGADTGQRQSFSRARSQIRIRDRKREDPMRDGKKMVGTRETSTRCKVPVHTTPVK